MRLALLLLMACGSPEPELNLPSAGVEELGPAAGADGQAGRERRRMTVPMLADSIEQVTGLRWRNNNRDHFEDFSPTLGVPDWIERTNENLTADLVFNKLLEDAATEVCDELVSLEADGGDRLLNGVDLSTTTEEDRPAIEAALSSALLRFHGHHIPVGDERLGGWMWLFESTRALPDEDPAMAWKAVCTALIIHPDFYTY